jgi:hypothetical protein
MICDPGQLTLDFLNQSRAENAISVVMGINHSPELALLCSLAGLPYTSWTIDPLPLERLAILPGTDLETTAVFVHRRRLVPLFQYLGFRRVAWLPLAAADHRFRAIEERPLRKAAFVGSSLLDEEALWQKALHTWQLGDEVARALHGFLNQCVQLAQNLDFGGFFQHPEAIPAGLTEALIGKQSPEQVAVALDAGLAVRFRQARVAALAQAGADVYGDGGWQSVVGAAWRGPLRDGQELTENYAAHLQIDVPRIHQREIATLRAMDVLASGGLLAAEPTEEFSLLFEPEQHFVAIRDTQHACERIRQLAHPPTEWETIRKQGQERVISHHRLGHRMAIVERTWEECLVSP